MGLAVGGSVALPVTLAVRVTEGDTSCVNEAVAEAEGVGAADIVRVIEDETVLLAVTVIDGVDSELGVRVIVGVPVGVLDPVSLGVLDPVGVGVVVPEPVARVLGVPDTLGVRVALGVKLALGVGAPEPVADELGVCVAEGVAVPVRVCVGVVVGLELSA